MAVNLILIIIGLIICFGGIYFRRFFSGIIGFVWGALLTVGLILIAVGTRKFDLQEYIVPALVVGVVLGIVSAVYYRICALINGFISGALIAFVIAALANDFEATAGVIIIALILGVLSAVLSFKFYDYSFVLMTAFLGGLIASTGLYGLVSGCDVDEIAISLAWSGSEGFAIIIIATLVLTIIGFLVQLKRLRAIGVKAPRTDSQNGNNTYRYNGPSWISRLFNHISSFVGSVLQIIVATIADAFSGFRTDENRAALKREFRTERNLLFAPVYMFFVVPLLYALLNKGHYSSAWFTIASCLEIVSTAITLAALAYYIPNRSKTFTLIIVALSVVSYLLFNLSSIMYMRLYYSSWYVIVMALRFLICWVVVGLISKMIHSPKSQIVVSNLILFLLYEYVINLIAGFSSSLRINLFFLARILVQAVAAYLIYKKRFAVVDLSSASEYNIPNIKQSEKTRNFPQFALLLLMFFTITAFAVEPLILKQRDELPTANGEQQPTAQEHIPTGNQEELINQEQSTPETSQITTPQLSSLRDGTYDVILYKNGYESREEGTYAKVDIEEIVRYSDLYVESLKIGSVVEGTVVESIESFEYEYGQEIWINDGNLQLYKGNTFSEWLLLWPSGAPVSHIVTGVEVLFPSTAQYYDEMTGVLETGETRQIERIEDYFEDNYWATEVVVTITVTNGSITEAYIYYSP